MDTNNEPTHEVLTVLDERRVWKQGKQVHQALIQWEGLAPEESSWEDAQSLPIQVRKSLKFQQTTHTLPVGAGSQQKEQLADTGTTTNEEPAKPGAKNKLSETPIAIRTLEEAPTLWPDIQTSGATPTRRSPRLHLRGRLRLPPLPLVPRRQRSRRRHASSLPSARLNQAGETKIKTTRASFSRKGSDVTAESTGPAARILQTETTIEMKPHQQAKEKGEKQ
ncbi:hypothetical protein KSP39_PZI006442 [Platanthera zijinensis]|uniref:Chromo domain-containing protein n=1 Tax=Platanthera zijinensis TaxID=2320716 RepID=A0AAP0BS43_9ASPA